MTVSYAEKAEKYADDVLSGKIPACKFVVMACQRFKDDLTKQATRDFPYIFDTEKANRVCRFMELLPHVKGSEWAGQNFTLEPWQCFIECNIFGWVQMDTGFRRFRTSFELIPRKNGKSMRVGARGIYLGFVDGEAGAEVYSGASSEKQAYEVYRPAWLMVQALPDLQHQFNITLAGNPKNPGTMYRAKDMSKFEVVIGKPGDGSSPHGGIVDEYHEHDSDHLVDTLQTGMGARRQPLLSIISTAGSTLNGPCHEMQKDVARILEGLVVDDTVFAIIYGIDEDDPWDSIESLKKANPNYDVSVFGSFLLAQLEQAKRTASKQNSFRTKHLNQWVGAKSAWIPGDLWARQRKTMKMEDFIGVPCHLAADLASKKDVAAVDVTFFKDGQYFSFKKFFVPEGALEDNDKYVDFVLGGHLEVTDGSSIDQERIEEYISEVARDHNVLDCAFDEWNADYLMTRLSKLRVEVIKFPFNVRHVSEPMKMMEAQLLDGKYWHDGNPVMDWMVGNVAARLDVRGNIFPNKERPNDHRCKIDGVPAAIMSLGRYMSLEEPTPEYKIFFV
jgi:phage terminase large subunit-like protein